MDSIKQFLIVYCTIPTLNIDGPFIKGWVNVDYYCVDVGELS